ncbi:MAG: hypothetical protein AVDCRST_MAG66-4892, partial [uncultured Pseudonocardia sp.]
GTGDAGRQRDDRTTARDRDAVRPARVPGRLARSGTVGDGRARGLRTRPAAARPGQGAHRPAGSAAARAVAEGDRPGARGAGAPGGRERAAARVRRVAHPPRSAAGPDPRRRLRRGRAARRGAPARAPAPRTGAGHRRRPAPRAARHRGRRGGGRARGARARRAAPGDRLAPALRPARHQLAVRPGTAAAARAAAAGARGRPVRPPRHHRPRGDRLHRRLVQRAGLARCPRRGARAAAVGVDRRRVGHRLPPPLPRLRGRVPAARHARRRAAAASRQRRPGAAGRARSRPVGAGSGGSSGWSGWRSATSRGGGSRRRPCSRCSEGAVHEQQVDVAVHGMAEAPGDAPVDREPEALPQRHRPGVGGHHGVELQAAV